VFNIAGYYGKYLTTEPALAQPWSFRLKNSLESYVPSGAVNLSLENATGDPIPPATIQMTNGAGVPITTTDATGWTDGEKTLNVKFEGNPALVYLRVTDSNTGWTGRGGPYNVLDTDFRVYAEQIPVNGGVFRGGVSAAFTQRLTAQWNYGGTGVWNSVLESFQTDQPEAWDTELAYVPVSIVGLSATLPDTLLITSTNNTGWVNGVKILSGASSQRIGGGSGSSQVIIATTDVSTPKYDGTDSYLEVYENFWVDATVDADLVPGVLDRDFSGGGIDWYRSTASGKYYQLRYTGGLWVLYAMTAGGGTISRWEKAGLFVGNQATGAYTKISGPGDDPALISRVIP
jgi:hypothetical protein